MSRAVLWASNIDSGIKELYKSKTLPDITGYRVSLELSDAILDALSKEGDHRTPALMVEDAQEACEEVCSKIVDILKDLDETCQKKPEATEREVKAAKTKIETEIKNLANNLKKVPKVRWDAWVKTRKQYKSYKWDCAGKCVLGALGAVGSGLALAAAVPTGGVTLALGIAGAVKTGLEACRFGAQLWAEAETIQKKVLFSIEMLKRIYLYEGRKSNKGGTKEAALTALNASLPLDLAPTMKVLKGDIELWSKKLAGIEVSADAKTKKALKLLKSADELEKMLVNIKFKEVAKSLDKLRKLRAAVQDALNRCVNESARVRDGRKAFEPIEKKVVPELKSRQPKWAEIFGNVLPKIVSLAGAAANAGLGFEQAESAMDYFQTAAGLAVDLASELKEMREKFA